MKKNQAQWKLKGDNKMNNKLKKMTELLDNKIKTKILLTEMKIRNEHIIKT